MSKLQQAINEMRNMRESYNAIAQEYTQGKQAIISQLQAAGVEVSDNASMEEVAEAMPQFTRLLMGNTQFAEGSGIYMLGDAILSTLTIPDTKIKKLHSTYAVDIPANFLKGDLALEEVEITGVEKIGSYAFQGCTNLKSFIATNWLNAATYYGADYTVLAGCISLEEIVMPRNYASQYSWGFNEFPNLHLLDLLYAYKHSGSATTVSIRHYYQHTIQQLPNNVGVGLSIYGYDYRFYVTDKFVANTSFAWMWNGSASGAPNAPDKWDDPEQPQFYTRGQQQLWYFKKYCLYNATDGEPLFEDMTGQTSPTLTLPANLKALVMADDEVSEYFSSRNWTIA